MTTIFTSTLFYNKHPLTCIDKTITSCIGSGFEIPRKILADNSEEFAKRNTDMCENLSNQVKHKTLNSPWQNNLCECNHAANDSIITLND